MSGTNPLQVVQVRVSQIDAQRASVEIVADYEDAAKKRLNGGYNNLEELRAWNNSMGKEPDVQKWPVMPYTRTRTTKDGRTVDRHVLHTEVPLAQARGLQVAVEALTNVGPDHGQKPGQDYRAGYRSDPRRDYDGRFARVDDMSLVRDVASFKARGKDLISAYGDRTVGELRLMFGGMSVSGIRTMKQAARAAVLGAALSLAGTDNRSAQGAVLGTV